MYVSSTRNVKGLKAEKLELYERGFPVAEVRALVRRHLDVSKFESLRGERNVFLVAPSTSGRNKIPMVFAKALAKEFGGEVVVGWAYPHAELRTARKGIEAKLKEPPTYSPNDEAISNLPKGAKVYLVDDVVTTGQTIAGLREVLRAKGVADSGVLSIGQSEKRLVSDRDIERISEKLNANDVRKKMIREVLLKHELKHFANYIERIIPSESDESQKAESKRGFLLDYFRNEYDRMLQLRIDEHRAARGAREGREAARGVQPGQGPGAGLRSEGPEERRRVLRGGDGQGDLGMRV